MCTYTTTPIFLPTNSFPALASHRQKMYTTPQGPVAHHQESQNRGWYTSFISGRVVSLVSGMTFYLSTGGMVCLTGSRGDGIFMSSLAPMRTLFACHSGKYTLIQAGIPLIEVNRTPSHCMGHRHGGGRWYHTLHIEQGRGLSFCGEHWCQRTKMHSFFGQPDF